MNLKVLLYNTTARGRIWPSLFSPTHDLWLAVLARAIKDILGRSAEDKKDALDWIESDDDFGINSFVSVCDTLGLDVNQTRKKITSPTLRWVWIVDGEEFNSLREAAQRFEVSNYAIYRWCLGEERKGGYVYSPRPNCGREIRT